MKAVHFLAKFFINMWKNRYVSKCSPELPLALAPIFLHTYLAILKSGQGSEDLSYKLQSERATQMGFSIAI